MKKFTRILILALATLQIVLCFSACKLNLFGKDESEETVGDGTQAEDTVTDPSETEDTEEATEPEATETDTEEDTEEATEEIEAENFVLTKEALANYSIVIPFQSSDDMNAVAKVLQRSIKDATGLTLVIKNDMLLKGETESEYEILVGDTNRKAGVDFYKNVKADDYGYALVGKKLIIVGYTNPTANNAVIEFKLDVLKDASKKEVIMDADTQMLKVGGYDKETILLNGVDISEYKIVYPNACVRGENEIAAYLQAYITRLTGHVIRCVNDSDEEGEYEIQIGKTTRITEEMEDARDGMGYTRNHAYVGKTDKGLWLFGNGKTGFYMAFSKLIERFEEQNDKIAVDLPASICETVQTVDVSVMNFNVYFDLSDTKRDPQDVITSVKQKSPDVFGLNESGKDWIELFLADSEISAVYDCSWGSAAEKGEGASYNPIFYRKDKYDLVESGTKWLSANPNKMSMFPYAKHYKIMSYAILRDKASGKEFMYLNVHLDGSNDADAQVALAEVRVKQAEVIKNFTKEYSYLPIVIGGDFNEGPSSSVIKGMSTNTRFKYAMSVAKTKVDIGTTKKVNSKFELIEKGGVLDYIFVTTESVTVKKYEQFDNIIDGKYPSDHLPVYAEISISY